MPFSSKQNTSLAKNCSLPLRELFLKTDKITLAFYLRVV
jgi:hypothetical protein